MSKTQEISQATLKRTRPSVFGGSSVEGLPVLHAIQFLLERKIELIPWTTIFLPTEYTLESLFKNIPDCEFAIMVLTADDIVTSRGRRFPSPRDNLLLELGLCCGALGRKRTFIVSDRSVDLKLPTDLAGLTVATFEPPNKGTLESALGPACRLLTRAMML